MYNTYVQYSEKARNASRRVPEVIQTRVVFMYYAEVDWMLGTMSPDQTTADGPALQSAHQTPASYPASATYHHHHHQARWKQTFLSSCTSKTEAVFSHTELKITVTNTTTTTTTTILQPLLYRTTGISQQPPAKNRKVSSEQSFTACNACLCWRQLGHSN